MTSEEMSDESVSPVLLILGRNSTMRDDRRCEGLVYGVTNLPRLYVLKEYRL